MRILLADDDPDLLESLTITLQREGFEVVAACDGTRAWELFCSAAPDLAVLDVSMPGQTGLELTQRISQSKVPSVPVILLTGHRDEHDKIMALESSADDYVIKPCSPRELIARIRAVWRRSGPAAHSLTVGGLVVDTAIHQVSVDRRSVVLTATEFSLLRTLMEHAGHVVRTNVVMQQVWGSSVSSDLLRVTIFRLRQKIERDPKKPRYIHTVSSVGFVLRDAESFPPPA